MPLTENDVLSLYQAFRDRYANRDERMATMDAVIRGDFNVLDPNEDKIEMRSPNLVQVALEDTAESAATLPTIRVIPARATQKGKQVAGSMEKIAAGYMDFSQGDILVLESLMDLAAFGFFSWVVWPDGGERLPVIERRDPRFCYPEPGYRSGQNAGRVMFARNVYFSQLPEEYKQQLEDFVTDDRGRYIESRTKVTLVEFFDEEEYVVAAIFEAIDSTLGRVRQGTEGYLPHILERIPNKIGVCPVVIEKRHTLDGEFRGQFDQIVGVLLAHIRLMGLVLDYADQAVYSDIWVKDLVGELSWGGGAYIELGPNGQIGRVPPAVTSFNVQQDLDRLVDFMHVGGRWPKARPGEVDQSIASAKFVEAVAGMMNTTIKTYHTLLARALPHALRLAFLTDQKWFPGRKVASGILRNQEFVEEYDTDSDIDVRNRIRAEYGLGLGRDPSQSAVLMLQYADKEYISHEFVQENIDGLTDVARERVRIDTQKFRQIMLAKLLQGVQDGTIPDTALVDIMDARERGEDLSALYRKYVVEPAAAAQQQPATPFGPPGAAGLPGGTPGGPTAQPPGGPAPAVPPAPNPMDMISRLSVPLGGGSFLGTQAH